jgi:acetylglutamate kinase
VIRVVKVGGRAQQAPSLISTLATAHRLTTRSLVLVHGGGDEVTALQRQMGRTPEFIRGRRVTSDEDIAILRMTLSGIVNKRLVAALVAQGVNAVGVSGEDAGFLLAEPIDAATMGRAGHPTHVHPELVRHLLAGGFLPVLSPLARDRTASDGSALNVNGDDAAASVAVALGAAELVLVADVPGVLHEEQVLPTLEMSTARTLMSSGAVTSGMIAKLEAAERALGAGVPTVRIGDLRTIVDDTAGTRIVAAGSLPAFTHVPA